MSPIFTTSIAASAFPVFKSTKFLEPTKLFARRLGFGGEVRCRRSVSWKVCRRNQRFMKGSNWDRVSTSEESVQAFEQESLVEESLAFGNGGVEATLNNLSKWLIAAAFGSIIIWRHDAEAVWAVMGSVINAMLCLALKQLLNQERPNSTLRSDPGMPSSHAQSITYTTMFIVLSIVEWYGINALTTTLNGLLILLGSYFTWLRVSQNLHTVSQVVVGAIIGSSFSFLWFWSWKAYVLNLFVSFLWVRLLIIVAATAFLLNHLYYSYRSLMEER
ncbi:hypothetical protein ACS0TY_029953 [Phlomoides rotata]